MKFNLFIILFFFFEYTFCQTNYINGNEAYTTECMLGFNPVTINNGEKIFIYDNLNKQYICGNDVLIPDKISCINGHTININYLFGFGIGGRISDSLFQWDNKSLFYPNTFDVVNMFVSPISNEVYSYANTLQHNSNPCNYGNCNAIIDGPASSLAYPDYNPLSDTFNLWTGEELVDAGYLKNTDISQKISQQQMDTTENMSSCVKQYGRGWRLPTDIEVGHFNDDAGLNNGLDSAYMGVSSSYIWTSTLFAVYNVKRWAVNVSSGNWENCGGFLYVSNHIRCVFAGNDCIKTNILKYAEQIRDIKIFPNPCNTYIYIKCLKEKPLKSVEIFSLNGELIKKANLYGGKYFDNINISDIANGIYFIKIIFGYDEFEYHKIIKIK